MVGRGVEKQRELATKIDELYQIVPAEINGLDSKTFVKYIKDDELEMVVHE